MTCKNCEHFEVCGAADLLTPPCKLFKDKDKIIELPIKIGDRVYVFSPCLLECVVIAFEIRSGKDNSYTAIFDNRGRIIPVIFGDTNIGKTVFFTEEAAQQALEEASNGKNKT